MDDAGFRPVNTQYAGAVSRGKSQKLKPIAQSLCVLAKSASQEVQRLSVAALKTNLQKSIPVSFCLARTPVRPNDGSLFIRDAAISSFESLFHFKCSSIRDSLAFMDLGRVLAQYDAEVRARPKAQPGFEVDQMDGVIRLTGHFNFISWWDLAPGAAREAVVRQAAYFRSRGEELIWRVYEHDKPAGLGDCLAAEGFEPEAPGTLMIFDLANQLTAPIGPEIEIRRVATMEDLQGFMAASDAAFGREESWRRCAYSDRLSDPDLALYVALVSGKVVASARLEMAASNFGLLFGGGVSPAYRRKGLYRALVAERAQEATRRGCGYLSADARETSRPILQNLGFICAASETTWVLGAS